MPHILMVMVIASSTISAKTAHAAFIVTDHNDQDNRSSNNTTKCMKVFLHSCLWHKLSLAVVVRLYLYYCLLSATCGLLPGACSLCFCYQLYVVCYCFTLTPISPLPATCGLLPGTGFLLFCYQPHVVCCCSIYLSSRVSQNEVRTGWYGRWNRTQTTGMQKLE